MDRGLAVRAFYLPYGTAKLSGPHIILNRTGGPGPGEGCLPEPATMAEAGIAKQTVAWSTTKNEMGQKLAR